MTEENLAVFGGTAIGIFSGTRRSIVDILTKVLGMEVVRPDQTELNFPGNLERPKISVSRRRPFVLLKKSQQALKNLIM